MTMNRRLFTSYKVYDGGHVVFGSNLKGMVIDRGNISHDSIIITNVEHVSGLPFNLISVGERIVPPSNPLGTPDNVLDNRIIDTASNDSHPSNAEMYLNDEEDDGDTMIIPRTPSEEIRTRIDNTKCHPSLLNEIGEDEI
ncbi:hypothetical protein Tco_1501931 [Tanacetum coccineum]